MTDILKPAIKQISKPHTTTVMDNTVTALVNDTNYLVDDTRAVVGGPTTPQQPMPVKIERYTKPRIR